MNLEQARQNMVEQQIRPWDVLDQDVLDLLYTVPREGFVPATWAPKIEARVLQELAVQRTERVLEIGTGSGYFTALLAHRAAPGAFRTTEIFETVLAPLVNCAQPPRFRF